MANSFIAVHKSKGIEYASVCTPARVNGKKVNNPIYLGRVININLEEGRFRNRIKGEFLYSLENGYSFPAPDPEVSINAAVAKGSLSLGHVYCAHKLLERTKLLNLFMDTEKSSPTHFWLFSYTDCWIAMPIPMPALSWNRLTPGSCIQRLT
jgi:hypothetical protein